MKAPKLELSKFTGSVAKATGTTADAEVDIARIVKRPQIRKKLGDLTEMAASIKHKGVLQPIILHAEVDGTFRLIAGERRLESAKLAGLTKIPAVIKRNLSELEIRGIQVAENNDREDIPVYDQVMGVIEDIDTHGFQGALSIWGRTEAWLSKRQGVKKYAEPVLKLLQDDLCGDLEVLQSLNQLHNKSEKEFKALVDRMRSGQTVGRDDVRSRLAAVKDWERLSKEHAATKPRGAQDSERAAAAVEDAPEAASHDGSGKKGKASAKTAASPAASSKAQRSGASAKHAPAESGRKVEREKQAVVGLREMLFDYGQNSKAHVASLQEHMLELQYDPTEAEWVMWSGFLTVTLPMLEALGTDRGLAYLRRLQQAVKGGDPGQLWSQLHPVREGEDPQDEGASRVPVPERPADWTF